MPRLVVIGAVLAATALTACGGGGGGASQATRAPTSSTSATALTSSTTPATTTATVPAGERVESGFVAFGDFGGGAGQYAVASAMTKWAISHRVDALVTVGDNVYPTGEPSLYASELDAPYKSLRAGRPMWVTLGNHDVGAGHGAEMLAHLGLPPLPYVKSLPNVQFLF